MGGEFCLSHGAQLGPDPKLRETFPKTKEVQQKSFFLYPPLLFSLEAFQSQLQDPGPDEQNVNKNQVTKPFVTGKRGRGTARHIFQERIFKTVSGVVAKPRTWAWARQSSSSGLGSDGQPVLQLRGERTGVCAGAGGGRGPRGQREAQGGQRTHAVTPMTPENMQAFLSGPERAKKPPKAAQQV